MSPEVRRILAPYGVSRQDISALIDAADTDVAKLWGAGDGSLIDEIASVWLQLAVHGVEPSDIRHMFDRKSKELWKSGRKGAGFLVRYNITEDDQRALIENGNPTKSQLCARNARLLDTVGRVWKHLVLYGVEPTEILRLMERKSESHVRAKTRGDNQ
jgi:hypothetical protein